MVSQISLERFTFETCEVGENRSNRGKKYNLAHILHIEEGNVILCKSCAYIVHWGNKYNLAQIL